MALMAAVPLAALLVSLLLAAAPSGSRAALFKATVSNCTQLQAKLLEWRDKMDSGAHSYRLTLACPSAGGRYDDCRRPPQSGAQLQAVIRVWGASQVTLEAGAGCAAGDARPRLSAAGPDDAYDPDIRARLVVATGPKARLSLKSLILDGRGVRPGVYLENAGRASLENVDLRGFAAAKCDAYPSWRSSCGGALLAYATQVVLKGVAFEGNTAAYKAHDPTEPNKAGLGGAIFAEAGSLTPGSSKWFSGTILAMSDTTFKVNNATDGGAIFINKARRVALATSRARHAGPKAVKVSCTGCRFEGNAGNCSALASARNDFLKDSDKLGAPLTIMLGSGGRASTFEGNVNTGGSGNAMCGSVVPSMGGKFAPSKLPKAVSGLTQAGPTATYNDYLWAQNA